MLCVALSFTSKCITSSLNRLPLAAQNEAVSIFRDIMDYMGDGLTQMKTASPALCASICNFKLIEKEKEKGDPFKISKMMEMSDEVYCQVGVE